MTRLAIIGGSGMAALPGLDSVREHRWQTPYGEPSAPVIEGLLDGRAVYFLARHGAGRHLPPHAINYRANIAALVELGATHVVTVNVVGGIAAELAPGQWVLPDQLIDYTWGRAHSYCEGRNSIRHVDMTWPFHRELAGLLAQQAQSLGMAVAVGGTYGCTQGPRLETAAEIVRLERDGCDIVGMTAMPEAGLAREQGLPYVPLCLVVNWAAGKTADAITLETIQGVIDRYVPQVAPLLSALATRLQSA
jgi:5'-deoxy-5'-methylthioadenosine phosphorylase